MGQPGILEGSHMPLEMRFKVGLDLPTGRSQQPWGNVLGARVSKLGNAGTKSAEKEVAVVTGAAGGEAWAGVRAGRGSGGPGLRSRGMGETPT